MNLYINMIVNSSVLGLKHFFGSMNGPQQALLSQTRKKIQIILVSFHHTGLSDGRPWTHGNVVRGEKCDERSGKKTSGGGEDTDGHSRETVQMHKY